jgi:hypothetical protein
MQIQLWQPTSLKITGKKGQGYREFEFIGDNAFHWAQAPGEENNKANYRSR